MTDFWKKNLDDMSDYKYKTVEDEIKINEPPIKKIFGSDFVEIRPQGSAELSFVLILLGLIIQCFQKEIER